MARRSLYRTYRPATFDDVVGQQHITRTLRNAVRDGAVAHAYLFTGPRGTGKTTTARLLAKALDCQKGPTGEPDGTCEDCIEIAEGRHPDVYELDAASRTGVGPGPVLSMRGLRSSSAIYSSCLRYRTVAVTPTARASWIRACAV